MKNLIAPNFLLDFTRFKALKILAFLLVSALFVNCSSDDKKQEVAVAKKLVKLIYEDTKDIIDGKPSTDIYSFKYTGNKLIEISSYNKAIYTYEGNQLKTIKTYQGDSLTGASNFTYTGNLITAEDGYDDEGFIFSIKNEYDITGLLIKEVINYSGKHGTYIRTNVFEYNTSGNLTKMTDPVETFGRDVYSYTYEYDTHINPLYGIRWQANSNKALSKNNITKEVHSFYNTYYKTNTEIDAKISTYKYDADGYPIEQIIKDEKGTQRAKIIYTYE
jgi:hypothetical protein